MVRLRGKRQRPVKIWRVFDVGGRELIDTVMALNLAEGIKAWVEGNWDDAVWADALFKANTVSILTRTGTDEMYAATD